MLKGSVHESVLLSRELCKQSITSLSLLVGTTVALDKMLFSFANKGKSPPFFHELDAYGHYHFL